MANRSRVSKKETLKSGKCANIEPAIDVQAPKATEEYRFVLLCRL